MSLLIKPQTYIKQGTIVDGVPWPFDPKPLGIILSNPCDLELGKASYLLIASLIPAKETLQYSREFINKIDPTNYTLKQRQWNSLKDIIVNYIHNKNIARYFFINPNNVITAPYLFIDFQHLLSIPIDGKETLISIAQLPSPYAEQMIVHFSSYISRIGVDRINDEKTEEIINEIASPYHRG
jgi:hypothetical protein